MNIKIIRVETMDWREITDDVGGNWPAEMKSLTLDAISPWISHGKNGCDPAQWKVAAFAMRDALALTTLVSKTGARQFTSLVCCAEAPEVVAVSFSDGRLFELNPFLEAGGPLEPELDCVAN
ncbi:MAG TPA: hypothetical protein ENJ99_02310, partial [Rhizobiales bacterium]|nr:hypothetical protein [Hyphomicrobiales bacterium]